MPWNTQINWAYDGPFDQTCCCEVRGEIDFQTCAQQWVIVIRLIPYERSWRPVRLILLVGTNRRRCDPVSQPARKEFQKGLIGEPLQPELLKGGAIIALQVALNVQRVPNELPRT